MVESDNESDGFEIFSKSIESLFVKSSCSLNIVKYGNFFDLETKTLDFSQNKNDNYSRKQFYVNIFNCSHEEALR